jgi:hypothetical protein
MTGHAFLPTDAESVEGYNGCGPGGSYLGIPKEKAVPDSVPGVYDFNGACAKHDRCYGDIWGTWRKTCDSAFYDRMKDSCPQTGTITINMLFGSIKIPNPVGGGKRGGCLAAA